MIAQGSMYVLIFSTIRSCVQRICMDVCTMLYSDRCLIKTIIKCATWPLNVDVSSGTVAPKCNQGCATIINTQGGAWNSNNKQLTFQSTKQQNQPITHYSHDTTKETNIFGLKTNIFLKIICSNNCNTVLVIFAFHTVLPEWAMRTNTLQYKLL